ncbi:MAG TPA: hypothetical protein VHI99_08990 [Vicinamibacterales bacterium]|jgi:hypothetical protein|nr:hypothetical protein [Vicinamibacterales bacterium]
MHLPLVVAQAIGEYGALAGLAAAFESVRYHVETAVREPKTAVPLLAIAIVAGYFLLRRR